VVKLSREGLRFLYRKSKTMHDTPIQRFLLERHPGYADLSADERSAINDFSLLWPLFEGSILGPKYRSVDLLQIPDTLNELGALKADTLAVEIAYFRARYYREGQFTPEFSRLHVERTNAASRASIRTFLTSGPEYPVVDAVKGILLIVLRLRNNLFHGVKALYGMQGQLSNFQHANAVLVCILRLHPPKYF